MSLFKLIISRNKENDVLEKSEQELLSDNIVDYCVSYFAGDLTESMIQELCIDLVKYCHLTKYPNDIREAPKIEYPSLKYTVAALYSRTNNTIKINKIWVDLVLNNHINLFELIDTIGHEMEHYHQDSSTIEYSKMSIEEQGKCDNEMKNIIKSYQNLIVLSDNQMEYFSKLFKSCCDKEWRMFDLRTIRNAIYSIEIIECEARKAGKSLAMEFINKIAKSKKLSFSQQLKMYFKKSCYEYDLKKEEKDYRTNLKLAKDFIKSFDLNINNIIKIVGNFEARDRVLNSAECEDYKASLIFMLHYKSINEIKSVLISSILNGYSICAEVAALALKNLIDFKKDKKSYIDTINSCKPSKFDENLQSEKSMSIIGNCLDFLSQEY